MSAHHGPGVAPGDAGFVRMADGCRIHLRQLKAGQGTPVLLVHALAMDGSLWADMAAQLRTGCPVHALDCRGHGLSDRPPGPYATAQFADDIAAVLAHLGAPTAHLVGCSMGGTVALAFAGRYPDRLASLTVIDATACYGAGVEADWEARGRRPASAGFASMLAFQRERWFSPVFAQSGAARIAQAEAVFLRNDPAAYLESCRMLGRADERPGLAGYRGPALVLVGADDYATPVGMAEETAALLLSARLAVLPGLRHFTPIEAPERIAAELDGFLLRTAGGA